MMSSNYDRKRIEFAAMGEKMKCTDELCLDHEVITAFLTILDLSIKKLESGKAASSEDLRWLFEFNRDFVIRNHNQKEANVLFPALVSAGFPEEQIHSLIEEHELIRLRAKTVRGFIEDYDEGAFGARARLADAGRRYIDLLKEHIEFEEKAVYPVAEELLSNELDEHLAAKLRVFVETRVGIGRLIDLQGVLDSLKEIYGIET
jgi:hemerythrin-like domain-containing protein